MAQFRAIISKRVEIIAASVIRKRKIEEKVRCFDVVEIVHFQQVL